jgi:hypothetical protein
MDTTNDRTNERDAAKGNERIKVAALAREILCNASGIMTMAEAVTKARKALGLSA